MAQTVKWLPRPEKHDFQAAEDYLSLIMPAKRAAEWRKKLAAARNDITHRKAKDILRASQLALLGEDNKHVAADLRKAASGAALSPILLLRGDEAAPAHRRRRLPPGLRQLLDRREHRHPLRPGGFDACRSRPMSSCVLSRPARP